MTNWPEQVSNEGHVYAAFEKDLIWLTIEAVFEDEQTALICGAAKEFAMEDGS